MSAELAVSKTQNASEVLFGGLSVAVEEKLEALNESLVDAFKSDNPDLWEELAGVRANFSQKLANLRGSVAR